MTRLRWAIILIAGVAATLVGLALSLPGLTLPRALLVGVNVATMVAYGFDKHAARTGGWRVPEAALHMMAAVGGTPGAFVARHLLRHKTRDRRFRRVFWLIALAQAVLLTLAV